MPIRRIDGCAAAFATLARIKGYFFPTPFISIIKSTIRGT